MTSIPDASVAAIIDKANQIKQLADDAIALLAPSGTFWDPVGVANNPTFSNRNLTVAATSTNGHLVRANVLKSPADQPYAEVHIDAAGSPGYLGIAILDAVQAIASPPISLPAVPGGMWLWRSDGYKAHGNVNSLAAPTYGSGDNVALFINAHGEVYARKNGAWIGDPVARTGFLFDGLDTTHTYTIALSFFGNAGSPIATGIFDAPVYSLPPGASLYE
jgi:hypothetical protein